MLSWIWAANVLLNVQTRAKVKTGGISDLDS